MACNPGMGDLADEAADQTDKDLADQEAAVLLRTSMDPDVLAKIRPQITDQETYDKLIEVVQQAVQHNESLAKIKTRIQALGEGAMALATKIAELAGKAM